MTDLTFAKSALVPRETLGEILAFRNLDQVKGAMEFTLSDFKRFATRRRKGSELVSPPLYVRGLEWRCIFVHDGTYISMFIHCAGDDDREGEPSRWSCTASGRLVIKVAARVVEEQAAVETEGQAAEQLEGQAATTAELESHFQSHTYHANSTTWGYRQSATIEELLNRTNGYLHDTNSLRVVFELEASEVHYDEPFTLTLKVDDFQRFVERREQRFSPSAEGLFGATWRLLADVRERGARDGLGNNPGRAFVPDAQLCVGFFLCCNQNVQNLEPGWEVPVTARLVGAKTQRRGKDDSLWKEYGHTFNADVDDWGWSTFVECEKLLDRSNGFLDSDGAVTLRAEVFPRTEVAEWSVSPNALGPMELKRRTAGDG